MVKKNRLNKFGEIRSKYIRICAESVDVDPERVLKEMQIDESRSAIEAFRPVWGLRLIEKDFRRRCRFSNCQLSNLFFSENPFSCIRNAVSMERRKIQQGVEAGKQEEERYGIYESKFSDPETKKTKKIIIIIISDFIGWTSRNIF